MYSIYPCDTPCKVQDGLYARPLANPLLTYKPTRIGLWYASLCFGEKNPYHRFQTALSVRSIGRLDEEFDVVVSEEPQMTTAAFHVASSCGPSVLLNKHNAMYVLVDQLLSDRPVPDRLHTRAVETLRRQEQAAIDRADAVVFQSERDREAFSVSSGTVVATIPNGTEYDALNEGGDPVSVSERFGLSPEKIYAVYVGSYDYQPNRDVAIRIANEFAPALPEVEFLLVGRQPPELDVPENVHRLGFVEDLPGVLSAADIAICPLRHGRGTKLKMMDYLAAGLPIVTTPVGADGIDVINGQDVLIRSETNAFVEAIQALATNEGLRNRIGARASEVGRTYSWDNVLEEYGDVMDHRLDQHAGNHVKPVIPGGSR